MADGDIPAEKRFIALEVWLEHRAEIKIIVGGPFVSLIAIAGLFVLYAAVRLGGNVVGFPADWIGLLEKLDFYGVVATLAISVISVPWKLFAVISGKK
jgi:hypothetical protein